MTVSRVPMTCVLCVMLGSAIKKPDMSVGARAVQKTVATDKTDPLLEIRTASNDGNVRSVS